MSSTGVPRLLSILLLPLLCSAQVPQADSNAHDGQVWKVGFIAVQAETLPDQNWFGGPGHEWKDSTFSVDGSPDTVVCRALNVQDFERNDLRLVIGPEGASVQIQHSSDIREGDLQDVGGVACLVSKGPECVLEFEIYTVYSGGYIRPLVGAVAVQAFGHRLAQERANRNTQAQKSPFARHARIIGPGDGCVSEGYVDEEERKQGVWVLRERAARTAISWHDGIPDGTVLRWDEQDRLRILQNYRAGLMEGESLVWTETGELRSWETYMKGRSIRRVGFHPNGSKAAEMYRPEGWAGTLVKWSESGELISEEKERSFITPENLVAMAASWDRCLTRFQALHTHSRSTR